ncbi:hypothetical protein BC937DRAFT_91263, partial [Endogone sp. FLAS-F59071]
KGITKERVKLDFPTFFARVFSTHALDQPISHGLKQTLAQKKKTMTVSKPAKATARAARDEVDMDGRSSEGANSNSEEFVQMITTLKNGIDKKSKQQQRKLSAECDQIAQEVIEMAQELEEKQAQEIEQKVANFKRKSDELTDEKTEIVKKLKAELEKFTQLHNLTLKDLEKIHAVHDDVEKKLVKDMDESVSRRNKKGKVTEARRTL